MEIRGVTRPRPAAAIAPHFREHGAVKKRQESRTAEGAAAVRAVHHLYDDPVIFDDPFAIELIDWKLARLCRSHIFRWLMREPIELGLGPVFVCSFCFSRYAEERLDELVSSGVDQYVLVGAGLDSFVLRRRDLADVLRVYELDHPASQRVKRERLASVAGSLPGNLELVPIDFERETLSDALSATRFSADRPAFFCWLGTVVYLTRSAVFETLGSLSRFAAPGSEVVFDYMGTTEGLRAGDRLATDFLRRATRTMGEPLVSEFDPQVLPEEVCRLGYELVANLSPKDLETRYLAGRWDGPRPDPSRYLAHFRTTGAG